MSFKTKKQKKTKSKYTTIGHIWESSEYEGQFNVTIKDQDRKGKNGKVFEAPGRLIFQDKASGEFYRVKNVYVFEVNTDNEGGQKAWNKGLRYNLALDLNKDWCVEKLDSDAEETDEEEVDE